MRSIAQPGASERMLAIQLIYDFLRLFPDVTLPRERY